MPNRCEHKNDQWCEECTFAPASTAFLISFWQRVRLWLTDAVEHNCPMAWRFLAPSLKKGREDALLRLP